MKQFKQIAEGVMIYLLSVAIAVSISVFIVWMFGGFSERFYGG